MKPSIINHPFRDIKLSYNSEAPLSELEQQALEKYTDMHNMSFQLKNNISRLHDFFTNFGPNKRQECLTLLNSVQNEYILVSPMLHYIDEGGLLPDNEVNEVNEEERVCYDTNALIAQLTAFEIAYDEYIQNFNQAEQEYAAMLQYLEHLNEIFDDFDDNYFAPIIKNYAQMQIDTVSLDQDFDDYRGAYTEVMKMEDSLCDARNALISLHKQLSGQWSALSEKLKHLFDELKKLEEGNG
jgi:uncharacterized phage infection (PIP) family protein YhgE